jgi:hypothetical protein
MPRAKPASDRAIRTRQEKFKPPTLTDRQAHRLAATLGIKETDGTKIAALKVDLDAAVERYGRMRLLQPTPGERAVAVKRAIKAMKAAFIALSALPNADRWCLRDENGGAIGDDQIRKLIVALEARHAELSKRTRGRPRQRMLLASLAHDLETLWWTYTASDDDPIPPDCDLEERQARLSARQKASRKRMRKATADHLRARDEWISNVLHTLGIDHPSPEHQQGRFRSLLHKRGRPKQQTAPPPSEIELRLTGRLL